MRAVVAVPACALLAGAAAGLYAASASPDPSTFVERAGFAALAAIVGLAALAVWVHQRSRVWLFGGLIAAVFFVGGALLAAESWSRAWRPSLRIVFDELVATEREHARPNGQAIPEEPSVAAVVTGVLRADASGRDDSISLSVDVIAMDGPAAASPTLCARQVSGGVLLTVAGRLAAERADDWRAGRTIRAPVLLRRPSRYLNPGAMDDERALARRGTTLVGTVKSGALVEVVKRGRPWAEVAAEGRAFARRSIAGAVGRSSSRAAAIVTAIVIGDRAGLDPALQRSLQEAGTYHVIAISGGNIAILAALTVGGFRIAGVLGRAAMVVAIGGLLAYAYLVGGGASVNRATLMAVVYFAARALDLRGPPGNALFLVAGVMVAADPLLIADPAFLLTFGATAAILMLSSGVDARRYPWAVRQVVTMLAASLAAEAALLPVGAVVFSRVTFAGLVLNLAAIPLMAVAQVAGMLVVLVAVVSPAAASWVGAVASLGAEGLVRSAGLVRFAPFVTWRIAPPSGIVVSVYYVSLLAAVFGFGTTTFGTTTSRSLASHLTRTLVGWIPLASAAIALASALWILLQPWAFVRARGDGLLRVTYIDVGQGDAALVTFPRGRTLLIDSGGAAGGTFDIGDRVVAPLVRRAGVRRLDILALTHGDADHIGGAQSLINEFRPRDVWEGIPVPSSEPLRALRSLARAVGARWTNVQAGDVTTIDDVEVVVRHPRPPDWERHNVRNDDSLVIELRSGEASFVLTGDIGRDAEEALAGSLTPSRLRVVKVPHHGSLTSSSAEFLRALAPRVAVVSVGRSNTFGHPAPAVLDRYRDVGAEVFRTDRDGAVMVSTDGHALSVETFTGRRFSVR